ncbi:DUF29 domain-containing protein [Microcoleus sp. FACHB-1515]|uniref:DUF29 domain-containing protein n=1 Tax=Cyanophyceae TaxID=3028117 RepID=UPI001683A29D|nr:DUF29 domain-containing protein [Microcoleus sp. FACHB-1515]MBD2089507.1 DUF29 domain-containing protein [Microcoleus sp. FACHB-1515]
MTAELNAQRQNLYETDYLQWIETTIDQMKQQNYGAIDWENLIEEIEDMGRSERRSLESNLTVILVHLLKWQFQPERRSNSWQASIAEHRRRIRKAFKDSPSLKRYLEEMFAECYEDAIELASIETGLPASTFLRSCPYTSAQVLEAGFLPE